MYENENCEFKSDYSESIFKTIIAFANSSGGTVYIGADNDGNKIGLKDFDTTFNKITSGVHDKICPDVRMFVKYETEDNIIIIKVAEGTSKPYYLQSKGLSSLGVFVRVGASSQPASEEQIRQFIAESRNYSWESAVSLNQNLTFDYTKEFFREYNKEFSENKYLGLGIINDRKLFTNLGLLLSDQCDFKIQTAFFSDINNTEFTDKKEFSGSLFRQLKDAFSYLSMFSKTASVIKSLRRVDLPDYDEGAIREALINAIIHRDYSFQSNIIIKLNNFNIQYINIGGLMPGISKNDIINGVSVLRNPKLTYIFKQFDFIEAYGTGVQRIFDLYKYYDRKPDIVTGDNSFRFILPNLNKISLLVNEQEKIVLDYIYQKGKITESEICDILGVKSTRGYKIALDMCSQNLIEKVGRGKEKYYKLLK